MTSRNRIRNRVRSTRVGSTGPISLESLESRRLLCGLHGLQPEVRPVSADEMLQGGSGRSANDANIVWMNKANTTTGGAGDTDGFGAAYGTTAPLARAVVDAVIVQYEKMIGSFNYGQSNDYQLTVSAQAPGTGFGGGAQLTHELNGKPAIGNLQIGGGLGTADPNDANGWFIDPTPLEHSEFGGTIVNAFAGDAHAGSPAENMNDMYTVVAAELAHCMGLYGAGLSGWHNRTTNTGISDNAEGQGTGNFWVFNGPSIKHLLTSNNGGPWWAGGSDLGSAVHGAGSGGDITFSQVSYRGAEDIGNAVYEPSRRYLVNETFALMFKDAYGYSTTSAAASGTFYSNLNQSTGVLTVRGGDFATGMNNSSDTITISRSGSIVTVSVDAGNDVPGTGALPGTGGLPAWVSQYDISQISSITVDAGNGDDAVNVSAQLGLPVSVQGGAGADVVNFNEPGFGQQMVANSGGFSSGITTVTIAGSIEASIMSGNGNNSQMLALATAPNRPLLIFGSSGNETITISSTNAANYPAYVQVNGGGGFDTLDVADGPLIGFTSLYSINGSSVVKNNGFAGLSYADVDRVSIIGETGPNQFDVLTGSQCPVHLNGGATQDVYNVLNTGTNAPVVIVSAFGNDTLNVNLDNVGQALAQTSGNQTFAAINIGNAARVDVLAGTNSTVTTGSLTLGTTGTALNLYDNDLIVDYTGPSQLAAVQAMINSARDNGWVTNGLTSWTARDNPQQSTTLGAMEATEYKSIYGAGATFNGRSIDNTAVLVKYTWYGDADFSGTVDFDDYVQTDAGFNNGRSGWMNGDFDGNGGVDFDDYVLIDLGLNSQTGAL